MKLLCAILSVLAACFGAYLTYKYAGAEDLRTKVYQPLYSELTEVEASLEARSVSKPLPGDVRNALMRTGDFQRLPRSLREAITKAYAEAQSVEGTVSPLTERVQRLVSSRIMRIRTEADDRAWMVATKKAMREREAQKEGVSPIVSFSFRHAGRGPGLDTRDPKNPKIVLPGGPTWQINDWVSFPQSVGNIESIWTDLDFLYFDDLTDQWYYRISRKDLRRHRVSLQQFLAPIYETLSTDPNFSRLRDGQARALGLIRDLKVQIAERISEPKRVRDMLDR